MSDDLKSLEQAQRMTALSLNQFMMGGDDLTRVHLKDVTEMANEVARVLPAGNVVRMVFSQLRNIRGRHVSNDDTRRMMSLLNQGMATFLDKATYMAFFTTPALLISGYQLLLRAAGKDPEAAFPDGTWQFYLEFGLREDSARHACETMGFKQAIDANDLEVSEADQLAAWIQAVSRLLLTYDELLAQEWRERLILYQLGQRLDDRKITARWVARRPYGVPPPNTQQYINYRQLEFWEFVREALSSEMREHDVNETMMLWGNEETLTISDRQSYQKQMSLLHMLEPGAFNDERRPLPLEYAQIAVIWNHTYYMIPLTHKGRPLDRRAIRAVAHSILHTPPTHQYPTVDELLITIPRAAQRNVRTQLPRNVMEQVEWLRVAPVIINWDEADAGLPLTSIRQGKRGIGDHALTLFRTQDSMVFDQSHIFFDAIWGMAVAEILTNQAIHNIRQMDQLPPANSNIQPPMLDLIAPPQVKKLLQQQLLSGRESSAEVEVPIVSVMNRLRRLMRQRNRDLQLTINDWLMLYRSLFNQQYRPSRRLARVLKNLEQQGQQEATAVEHLREMLKEQRKTSPAFLIPIDASATNPQARIYPVTYSPRPPWTDIAAVHAKVWKLWGEYTNDEVPEQWSAFNKARTQYMGMIRMFGVLMARYKEIALEGETMSVATLKILGTVPKSLQKMLSNIPDKIDILNDMLKGTEVFSNVGKVAETSSLARFITAKDDNQKKELCWGVMTRADDTMIITVRDFRPAVVDLMEIDPDVAQMVTRDLLEGFAKGLTTYVRQLAEIVQARKKR